MKVATKQGTSLIQGEVESVEMSVSQKGLAKMTRLLRDQIYTHKAWAVVREIVANAIDEHEKHGIARPVSISLPTMEDPHFRVRDYALGLPKEKVFSVFFQYFESTKDQDNSNIGGFGIGAKAPLSYADMFFVDSYHGGVKTSYVANLNGEASTAHRMDLQDSSESGIEVAVPVQSCDFHQFRKLVAELLWFGGFNVEVTNGELEYPKSEWQIENQYGKVGHARSIFDSTSKIYANIKGIMYAVDKTEEIKNPFYNNVVLFFTGEDEIEIHPSRERVELTKRNIVKINNKIEELQNAELNRIKAEMSTVNTARERFAINASTAAWRNSQVFSSLGLNKILPSNFQVPAKECFFLSWTNDSFEKKPVRKMFRYHQQRVDLRPNGFAAKHDGYFVRQGEYHQNGSIVQIDADQNVRYDHLIAFAEKNNIPSPLFVVKGHTAPESWVEGADYWFAAAGEVSKEEAKAIRQRMGQVSTGSKNTGCGIAANELMGYTSPRRCKYTAVSLYKVQELISNGKTILTLNNDTDKLEKIVELVQQLTDWKIVFTYGSHSKLWKKSGLEYKSFNPDKFKKLCEERLGDGVDFEFKNGLCLSFAPHSVSQYQEKGNRYFNSIATELFPDIQLKPDTATESLRKQAQARWDALSKIEQEMIRFQNYYGSDRFPAMVKQGKDLAAKIFA